MAEYIKREDAEMALLERCKETGYGGLTPDDIRLVMWTPWRIPAADVRPVVRGKWITVKHPLYECSICGAVYQDVGYGFNYCPNCGADMREPPKVET